MARRADAVLVSDYGLGAAAPSLVRRLTAKRLTLDSRYRLLDYAMRASLPLRRTSLNSKRPITPASARTLRKLEELGGARWAISALRRLS